MRARGAVVLVIAFVLTARPTVSGWSYPAHRRIADGMIALLPAPLRPLFEARRAFVVEHAVDPDLWRTAGWDDEPPNHFLDFDFDGYGPYPFNGLPRDYDRAVEKFGRAVVHQQGLLPWRAAEFYGKLERAFASLSQPAPPRFVLDDILLLSAALSHYVADAHQPLHAVSNYDGRLTGQAGAHSRFEDELFDRYSRDLRIVPMPRPAVADPREEMFRTLLDSNGLAARALAADRAAAKNREYYDDGYFEAFRAEALPIMDQRVADSTSAAAAFITGAWERAGKPAVPVTLPRTPRRVGPPGP